MPLYYVQDLVNPLLDVFLQSVGFHVHIFKHTIFHKQDSHSTSKDEECFVSSAHPVWLFRLSVFKFLTTEVFESGKNQSEEETNYFII